MHIMPPHIMAIGMPICIIAMMRLHISTQTSSDMPAPGMTSIIMPLAVIFMVQVIIIIGIMPMDGIMPGIIPDIIGIDIGIMPWGIMFIIGMPWDIMFIIGIMPIIEGIGFIVDIAAVLISCSGGSRARGKVRRPGGIAAQGLA